MPIRAADDFDTIRTRLEQIRKEQEEAQKNTPQQTNATEQNDPGANYDYGCTAATSPDKLMTLSEAPVGLQYYDTLIVDDDDNIVNNGITLPAVVYSDQTIIINGLSVPIVYNRPISRVLP